MKKGFVALLIALAVIILASPGIIGHLAERSMDENLDWAVGDSDEVVVTSQGFDRGWFSSEGRHRIEISDGELRALLMAYADDGSPEDLPVLIIDTRLDHGLIPVGSMARDEGTLLPGLGSAVSTLSIETTDGRTLPVPGTIYSDIGLTGNLNSNFVLEAGSIEHDGITVQWGVTDIEVTTDPDSGAVAFAGAIAELSVLEGQDAETIGGIEFGGDQRPTAFGLREGDFSINFGSIRYNDGSSEQIIGPLTIDSAAALDGDRFGGRVLFRFENAPMDEYGAGTITARIFASGVDARSLGRVIDTLDSVPDDEPESLFYAVSDDLINLMASGFEVRFEQLDVDLPDGALTSTLRLSFDESDADGFIWTDALLALDASATLRMPAALIEQSSDFEGLQGAIGLGYLRPDGDDYTLEAEFKNGLLTVNGAPHPIPIPGLQ